MRSVPSTAPAYGFLAGALAFAAALVLLLATAHAEITATGFTVKGDDQSTRIVIHVTEDLGYAARVIPDPFRLVLDMADVSFDIPPGQGRKRQGLVKAVRYGVLEEGKSRIVIDTDRPVLIENSFLKPAKGKEGPQIVIDLMAISEEIFDAAYAKDNPGRPRKAKPQPEPETVASIAPAPVLPPRPVIKPVPKPVVAAAPKQVPKQVIAKPVRADGKKVIVIDAGHGGMDSGAVSPTGTLEKDVVLAFALTLKSEIDRGGRHVAVLTRSGDTFMSLLDRVKFARNQNADLMIAIHADIVRGKTATGTTLYTLSDKASDEEAQSLADKENKSDVIGGIDLGIANEDVTDILIELIQRESKNNAAAFSQGLLRELKSVTPMAGKPLRSAGFKVLKAPDVPSVLIELGFLSTKLDEERLTSPEWRAKTAKALATAIDRHFEGQAIASQ